MSPFFTFLNFLKKRSPRLKNHKNDRSDDSLKVNHLGDVSRVPGLEPILPSGDYHKKGYISPGSGSLVGDNNTQSVMNY
jgi:hypothetical protein